MPMQRNPLAAAPFAPAAAGRPCCTQSHFVTRPPSQAKQASHALLLLGEKM